MGENPFVVHVARLRRAPGTSWHEIRRGVADPDHTLDGRSAADTALPEGAEAVCDVHLEAYDGGVLVYGEVRAPWQGVCGRCTAPVGGELRAQVHERFCEPGARRGDPVDEDAYPIVGDELDLRPMVRDALALELPLAPVCREDCAGLCLRCGADLNEGSCGCVAPADPRWANLDVLRPA